MPGTERSVTRHPPFYKVISSFSTAATRFRLRLLPVQNRRSSRALYSLSLPALVFLLVPLSLLSAPAAGPPAPPPSAEDSSPLPPGSGSSPPPNSRRNLLPLPGSHNSRNHPAYIDRTDVYKRQLIFHCLADHIVNSRHQLRGPGKSIR